ncbi:helix-turn-helix transcriptional regulator [Paractinoplanes rishiriensis]|uniref:Transcriptional regulator n=1 Tax=Paractinoplanes rishiriensis TaxID=1050105 RepID=A0A919JUS0_9ACTN|nr:LuxR family transcriptional regulator [Actinoplanes rishiriensis]GIE93717.1 transcriptional regulator [Actinoplanes rishiriensis]
MRLFGRSVECAALDEVIAGTRAGRSASLVLRGEAGVGKTTLLRYAESTCPGALWIGGVEAEARFPYAALHRLLIPLLAGRDRLPASQRAAVQVACGLTDGPPPDLYLVSLAALTLLAEAPRLVVVDDAQWLDRESLRALAFVARRLHAEGVVLLFGLRTEGLDQPDLLAGVEVRDITGLDREAAVALLAGVVDTRLDPALADQIAAATGGNPLALTDLGRELTADQLRGARPLPEPVPIGSRLEAHYSTRIRALPARTRTWLLLAAANAGGTDMQLIEAAHRLGTDLADAAPAETDRLVTGSPPATFRHPLVRSAVYNGATSADRRAVHEALAAVITGTAEADRRAWHLAAAADGPDEAVAAELERCADRAGARGGHTARHTFLSRAAELTPEPGTRAIRQVQAAAAALTAGAFARALLLLDAVDETGLPGPARGSALLTRAIAAVNAGVPTGPRDGAAICLAAAEAFGDDRDRARAAVIQAVEQMIGAEHLASVTEAEVAAAAAELAGTDLDGLLLAGYAAWITEGFERGVPALRRAVAAITDPATPDETLLARIVIGVNFCNLIWDDEPKQVILERAEMAARRTGALHALDLVHFLGAMTGAVLGRLADADRHDAAGQRLRRSIGLTADQELVWRHPELLTWRAPPGVRETVRPALEVFEMLHLGGMQAVTRLSLALLDIAEGDYASARELLGGVVEFGRPHRYAWALPDLVEAALRSGDRPTAMLAYADLVLTARASDAPRARGLLARCTALLAGVDEAEEHYRQAIEELAGTLGHGDLARAHLLYGEWLRRRRRRRDARGQLSLALAMFTEVRAEAFAERTRQELRALGDSVLVPVPPSDETALTPQETAVARLARDGGTNAEIAAHLFLSANTVDYHLRKVYRKLGVRSRRQLRQTLHD